MKDLKNNELDSNKQVPELLPVSKGRRQLTKAGLIAPVLMSFSSRPAWAAVACSASGMLSGNLSGPFETCDNSALSADYWDANRNQWSCAGLSDTTLVSDVFTLGGGYFQSSTTLGKIFDRTAVASFGSGSSFEHCAKDPLSPSYDSTFHDQLIELIREATAGIFNDASFPNYSPPVVVTTIEAYVAGAYNTDNTGNCGIIAMSAATTELAELNNVNEPLP